jgi:hypothetical protein
MISQTLQYLPHIDNFEGQQNLGRVELLIIRAYQCIDLTTYCKSVVII